MLLAGGIMTHGFQCGQVWGAALAAGARAYRLYGPGPKAEAGAIIAAKRIADSFRERFKHIDCFDLTGADWQKKSLASETLKYFLRGAAIRCFHMAGKFPTVASNEINTAFSETDIGAPTPPVSCAALLAQKMGVSEMHQVMAAGLAGGIGLSGGACGALGTAIWIIAMRRNEEESGKIDFADAEASDAIARFMQSSDFEFGCAEIVGRKFEDVKEHADYLREGGCSEIIEGLATEESTG
ncbi:MAG: C_GCAxxG_C_C family protein [bacterium]|nr:C_GCAxxG_C_C family protein [bacterium]